MIDAIGQQQRNPSYDGGARTLLIADAGDARRQAAEAIAAAGSRVADTIGWESIAEQLTRHAAIDTLMIEAQQAGSDRLASTLPRIDTFARTTDIRVVIAIDAEQIDLVTAHLFGPHVQLLCAPTLIERVSALCLAGGGRTSRLHDATHEAEGERLRRLNDEVARIAQTLARLTRRDEALPVPERPGMLGDRRTGYGAPPSAEAATIGASDIRQAIRSRRLRDQYFDHGLFEDPAWDMLLDLFAAELEDRAVSVSSLCIAAAVAPTTALRWIGKMSDAGLFERRPDPFDRRRAFMALSAKARDGMRAYCGAVQQAGLVIA